MSLTESQRQVVILALAEACAQVLASIVPAGTLGSVTADVIGALQRRLDEDWSRLQGAVRASSPP